MGTQYHKKILTNKVYTGDLIQRQGEMVSYKVKNIGYCQNQNI